MVLIKPKVCCFFRSLVGVFFSFLRLAEDEGVINRCGFNSHGLKAVQQRLKKREASAMVGRTGLLGINVGKNKLSEVRAAIFVFLAERGGAVLFLLNALYYTIVDAL